MKKYNLKKSSFFFITFFIVTNSYASYYGRFISGGFFSKEIFRATQVDRYNDLAILSERLYVNFDKILGSSNGEFTVDLRDKNNFFDKLDSERTKLIAKNRIQLHEFNFHKDSVGEGTSFSLGRFPISEAGAIYVDGVDFGFRKNIFGMATKFSLFYGLNPQLIEDSQITINKDLKAYGGYFILEYKGKDWDNYLYSTSSIVRQVYKTEIDRAYFFNNTNIQTVNGQNFSSIFYLDLVPKIYIQNFWTTYLVTLDNKYKLRTSLSTIDSIHYSRVQDVREVLPSSRYHQTSMAIRSPSEYTQTSYETKLTLGLREVDKKNLAELKFGAFFPKVIKDEISGNLNTGLKKNFTTNDFLVGMGLLHSNKFREIALSQDIQLEKKLNEKLNTVYITEGSYTKFFDRSLFGVLSAQNTWDNNVSIFSIFLKISYRFGEGGQAPIRDGSPPMGQL